MEDRGDAAMTLPDVLETLRSDHRRLLKKFQTFDTLHDAPEAQQTLVECICTELTIHAQLEEELLYPALRDILQDHALLDDAEVEHLETSALTVDIESMEPGDDLYDATVRVLGKYLRAHIEEEEEKLFPKIRKAQSGLDWLAEELHHRRQELRIEFGLPESDDGPDDGTQ